MLMGGAWNIGFYLLVVGAGVSVAVQQVLNANLRSAVGSPWWAGLASYLMGTVVMLALVLVTKGPRLSEVLLARPAPISWVGGMFGALFVGTAILMIPRLGAATVLALVVVGQMAGSVVIDHFGLFGTPQHLANPVRLLGVVVLIVGVIMVRR
jgi:transporter family-2 protein